MTQHACSSRWNSYSRRADEAPDTDIEVETLGCRLTMTEGCLIQIHRRGRVRICDEEKDDEPPVRFILYTDNFQEINPDATRLEPVTFNTATQHPERAGRYRVASA